MFVSKNNKKKDSICEVAINLMQKRGFENVTIKEICEEVGISNGMFFQYFKTKEEPVLYLFKEKYLESPAAQTHSGIEEGDFVEQIKTVNNNYLDFCADIGVDLCKVVYSFREEASPVDEYHNTWYNINSLIAAQQRGYIQPQANPLEIAQDCCTILKGTIYEWCQSNGRTDPKKTAGRIIDICLQSYKTEKYLKEYGSS